MALAKGLTQHSIVLCVEKKERAIPIEALLTKKGFKVVTALGLYDALRNIEQEMPHMVICEAILADGTVGTIYDKLLQNPLLKSTPILVLVVKKTKEQLTPLTGRKFAGFLLGELEGPKLLAKMQEILNVHHDASPHFVSFDRLSLAKEMTLATKATVLGTKNDQLVFKSDVDFDAQAAVVCVPNDKDKGPALLTMGSTMVQGTDSFNMFPISRIKGKGRLWIEGLPGMDEAGGAKAAGTDDLRRVLFFDTNGVRIEQFKKILGGYRIDIVPVTTAQAAVSMLQRDASMYRAAYFNELNAVQTAQVKELLGKLPPKGKVAAVIGTTSQNIRSTPEMRYMQKPFGLGVLVETLESAFQISGDGVAQVANAKPTANLEVELQAPAKILGMDEVGGIIELRFPMGKGTKIRINHAGLAEVWGKDTIIQIASCSLLEGDTYHCRFETVTGNENKTKYWTRIKSALDKFVVAEPEVPAEDPSTPSDPSQDVA